VAYGVVEILMPR